MLAAVVLLIRGPKDSEAFVCKQVASRQAT